MSEKRIGQCIRFKIVCFGNVLYTVVSYTFFSLANPPLQASLYVDGLTGRGCAIHYADIEM
jgi:hypothetical protein